MDIQPLTSKRLIRAVIISIIAALCYSVMTLLVKLAAPHTTESITVYARFTVGLLWVMLTFSYKKIQGTPPSFKTKHLGLHVLRAVCGLISILTLYYALKYVALASAASLALSYNLFIPILSFIFLRTKTSFKNGLALVIGFLGIVFILKPFDHDFDPIGLVALISGIASAGLFIITHELAKDDKPYTIMAYFFTITFILNSILIIFNWKTPDLNTLWLLLAIGIIGTAYQELLIRALLYAPPKIVAPILYSSMIFSGFFDWLFWRNLPDPYFWLGTILVTSGCMLSIKYTTPNTPSEHPAA